MSTFLFDKTIFGPVKSRRLGVSLGINLLPNDHKICSYDCIYCECGFNPDSVEAGKMPSRNKVYVKLEKKLKEMRDVDEEPDVITFAGNGEPTLHPEFDLVIKDTIKLRDRYCPDAKIAVLSNATTLSNATVVKSLLRIDQNILKIDSAIDQTFRIINQPAASVQMEELIQKFEKFRGELILQTMFIKGSYNGQAFDNTTEEEVNALLDVYKKVSPNEIMIYSIARDTPVDTIEKIDFQVLKEIAKKIETLGIKVSVS